MPLTCANTLGSASVLSTKAGQVGGGYGTKGLGIHRAGHTGPAPNAGGLNTMTTVSTALSTPVVLHAVLAVGLLLYIGTISCTAILAVCGRTPRLRRDARDVLALLLAVRVR